MRQNKVNLLFQNINNYGIYSELIHNGGVLIDLRSGIITNENLDQHFDHILNIMRDGIEQTAVHTMVISIIFEDGMDVNLSIFDYFFNLIFWKLPLCVGDKLTSRFLFFDDNITKNTIKKYIDENFLDIHRTSETLTNMDLNNIIDDTLYKFKFIDEFSLYLLNTINLEDSIKLMSENREFNDCIHCDLSRVPIEDVKDIGMRYANRGIKIIKESGYHCLVNSLNAREGTNEKQLKEFHFNIGSKPNGDGGVFPQIINTNFLTGGVRDTISTYIDSVTARIAQILSKNNVGKSGHFARLLGLNNMETHIHNDPHYSCNTKNFEKIYIENAKILDMFKNRYYRFAKNGIEHKTTSTPAKDNVYLIGQTVYFRSPMTCASNARGEGICYKCYGDLSYTNNDVNIGKIAAEIISALLTQKLLSAKHLLESQVKKLEWAEGFHNIFEIVFNIIKIPDDFNCKKWKLIINADDISYEDELDDFEYNEYITRFEIMNPNGEIIPIYSRGATDDGKENSLYFCKEFNEYIYKKGKLIDDKYIIDFEEISDIGLFLVNISNNELSATLEKIKSILNKTSETNASGVTKDSILQEFIKTIIQGGLNVDAVHCEILLSNQIRSKEDILLRPEWEYPNEPYQLITLNKALTDNPSITISMMYQKLSKALFYPLSFKKSAPSSVDLFYMEQPQEFMASEPKESDIPSDKDIVELISPFMYEK